MSKIFKKNTSGLKVLTPNGYKPFAGVAYMGDKETLQISLSNGMQISCSTDHKIYISETEYVHAIELTVNQSVMTLSGYSDIISIVETGKIEPVYDLIEVEDGHRYYTNGVLSSNCEFITADETLINGVTLLKLQGVEPLFKTNEVRWYQKLKANTTYVVALDPSAGVGKDPAAIEVFSLPDMCQVAEWTHNRTSIPNQVKTMQNIVNTIYNEVKRLPGHRGEPEIYFTLENNSWGEAALLTINEIGEERFNGIMLNEQRVRGMSRPRRGLNTNVRSKALACTKLKSLIESDRLKLFSRVLVRQLKFFVAKGDSFAAKQGENDDCVMATLLCVRMMYIMQSWDEKISDIMRDNFGDDDHYEEPMPMSVIIS